MLCYDIGFFFFFYKNGVLKKPGVIIRLSSSHEDPGFINCQITCYHYCLCAERPVGLWLLYLPSLVISPSPCICPQLLLWIFRADNDCVSHSLPWATPPATEYKCARGGGFIILGSVEFQELRNYLYQRCNLSFNKSFETAHKLLRGHLLSRKYIIQLPKLAISW